MRQSYRGGALDFRGCLRQIEPEAGADGPLDGPAPRPYAPVEYVWTEQYGRKIQIMGRPWPRGRRWVARLVRLPISMNG